LYVVQIKRPYITKKLCYKIITKTKYYKNSLIRIKFTILGLKFVYAYTII
jgi:hypothetical protein